MIGRPYYSQASGDYVVDLDGGNGWAFATAAEAERFAEVFRAALCFHAEVEREECARLCDAEATWQAKQGRTTEFVLRAVAREIRARAPQAPPQRPETPCDVATPAPDAPTPAGGLPVAAAGVCPACKGSGRVLYAREVEDGCDECEATGRVAAEGGER